MSLQNIKKLQAERGFTIVELLIVIVVIGILAAIVIVAYNGIQNQARNTNNKTDAISIVKVAEAVNAGDGTNGGQYPSGADTSALTASFNSTTTTKLPQGVAITRVTAAPTDNAAAITAADGNPRTYSVWACTGGVNVYYPVRGGSLASVSAGTPCS